MNYTLVKECNPNNFFKNVLASPNKDMIAVDRNDSTIMILDTEGNLKCNISLLNVSSCSAWFPLQSNSGGVLAVSSKERPIVLYNTTTGESICNYVPFNHVEAIDVPLSIDFTVDTQRLVAGGFECIRVFDVQRPGSDHSVIKLSESRSAKEGVKGRVSSLSVRRDISDLVAAGSFDNHIGILDLRSESLIFSSTGNVGSIFQVSFSQDGWKLYSYARKDSQINVWDLRTMTVCNTINRPFAETSQRLHFSLYNDKIAFGDKLGNVYMLTDNENGQMFSSQAHECAVSGVCVIDNATVISCSGERQTEDKGFAVVKSIIF